MKEGRLPQIERKARQERADFELFRRLFAGAPPAPFVQPLPTAPDILIPLIGRTLGVERTTLSLDSGSTGGSAARKRDRLKAEILSATKRQWESLHLPPVFVNVTWQDRSELSPALTTAIVENLVGAVESHLPAEGSSSSIEYPGVGWKRLLRLGVGRVSASRVRGLPESTWVSTYGGAVPDLAAAESEVRRLLQKKEPKIAGYRLSCDEVWFVIAARGGNMASELCLDEAQLSRPFLSSFDRAFLLSWGRHQVLELAVLGPH